MKYAALLFDLDGTLVNSIDLWGHAVIESLATVGIAVTHEHFREWYIGARHLGDWLAEYGLSEKEVPGLRPLRDRRYIELLRKDVSWEDGAKEALAFFRGKLPLGLMTGSWMSYVDAID